jgi:predicted DNA-binding transcriptional regulator AlpA
MPGLPQRLVTWCRRHLDVVARVPLSYPTTWKWMRADKFPRSHRLGEGKFAKSVWYEHEIEDWQARLPIKQLTGDLATNQRASASAVAA